MALRGGLDLLTHRRIAGWAWESDAPDVQVWLLITIGSQVLDRCRADQFREDLEIEGYGLGRCGFALDLPAGLLSVRKGYEIAVRREGDGLHLPGSLLRRAAGLLGDALYDLSRRPSAEMAHSVRTSTGRQVSLGGSRPALQRSASA